MLERGRTRQLTADSSVRSNYEAHRRAEAKNLLDADRHVATAASATSRLDELLQQVR